MSSFREIENGIGRDLESQIAVMEEFIDNVKILISALVYKVLEPLKEQRSKVSVIDGVLQEDVLLSSPSYAAMFVIGNFPL